MQQVTVDSLLAEKERLEAVIASAKDRQKAIVEEAKQARMTITMLNRMIVMYGNAPEGKGGVVVSDGRARVTRNKVPCPICDKPLSIQGGHMHLATHQLSKKDMEIAKRTMRESYDAAQ